jgi:hypothetical protein
LNPANGLIETADLDAGNPSFAQNMPLGVIINKRTDLTGFVCDLVIKGKLLIPQASLGTIDADPVWAQGAVFYLTALGQMTSVAPALEIPVGISLAPTPQGDYNFLVDVAKNTELKHKHTRDVLTWDPNGNYTLAFEPVTPNGVFLEIDDQIQTFDDTGVGNWFAPPDPDYTVAGKALTLYTPARYEGNPEDPKVVAWYTSLTGSTANVTGIVAGKNISLSGCDIDNGVGTGHVVISGTPVYNPLVDAESSTVVKKIELNENTLCVDVTSGPAVTKIIAGQRISISGPEVTSGVGTGSITINASPTLNSSDLLVPESVWLENAKNDLLYNRFDCAIIEDTTRQSLIAKFKLPPGIDENYTGSLVLDYIVSSGVPTADLTLLLDCFQLELSSNLANAPSTTFTSSFSIDSGDAVKLVRQEITLSKLSLKKDATLVIEVSRDVSDIYTGNFNILNTRLRYRAVTV